MKPPTVLFDPQNPGPPNDSRESFGERGSRIRNEAETAQRVSAQCRIRCRWRRERDLNPRTPFGVTRFPSVRTRPLCDLSLFYKLRPVEIWGPRAPNLYWSPRSCRALAARSIFILIHDVDPDFVSFGTNCAGSLRARAVHSQLDPSSY